MVGRQTDAQPPPAVLIPPNEGRHPFCAFSPPRGKVREIHNRPNVPEHADVRPWLLQQIPSTSKDITINMKAWIYNGTPLGPLFEQHGAQNISFRVNGIGLTIFNHHLVTAAESRCRQKLVDPACLSVRIFDVATPACIETNVCPDGRIICSPVSLLRSKEESEP